MSTESVWTTKRLLAKTKKRRRQKNAEDDDNACSLAGVGPTDVMAGADTGPAAPLDGVNPLANNRNQSPPLEDVDMNLDEERGATEV